MEFSLPQVLLFIFLISLHVSFILFLKSKKRSAYGFKSYPIVGSLPGFLCNRHRFLDWTTEVLSGSPGNVAVFRRPGKVQGVMHANPQLVEHMLKSNFENYPKGNIKVVLRDFLGDGIFSTDGESWRLQRKTASYEFNTKSLRYFVMDTVTVELQNRLLPLLQNAAVKNRVLDIQDILERFAFDNICKVAFNVDPGCLDGDGIAGGEFMKAFEDATTLSSGRFMYAIPKLYVVKKFFDLGSEKKLRISIATVNNFAEKIIRTRLEDKAEKKDEDLLSRFIGNGETSCGFLRDIVISFILAGRDTTSSALSFFFWLLSSNPDVEQKILQELDHIRRQNGKAISDAYSFDDLREMHYLQAAISEAMRLYPPVPIDTRCCRKDDVLPDGTFIEKDWFITYNAYAMGRMESIWGKDCCEYKPERWLDEGICRQESPFKFPVFNAGPRMCLGKDMAYIQMKSIAASVLERFRMEVMTEKGPCPQHVTSLTLRMKGGLPVNVKERLV